MRHQLRFRFYVYVPLSPHVSDGLRSEGVSELRRCGIGLASTSSRCSVASCTTYPAPTWQSFSTTRSCASTAEAFGGTLLAWARELGYIGAPCLSYTMSQMRWTLNHGLY